MEVKFPNNLDTFEKMKESSDNLFIAILRIVSNIDQTDIHGKIVGTYIDQLSCELELEFMTIEEYQKKSNYKYEFLEGQKIIKHDPTKEDEPYFDGVAGTCIAPTRYNSISEMINNTLYYIIR